jgi:hypothetical protein
VDTTRRDDGGEHRVRESPGGLRTDAAMTDAQPSPSGDASSGDEVAESDEQDVEGEQKSMEGRDDQHLESRSSWTGRDPARSSQRWDKATQGRQ